MWFESKQIDIILPISRAEVTSVTKGVIKQQWQRRWDSSTKGRHSRYKGKHLGRGRREQSSRITVGHSGLKSSLHLKASSWQLWWFPTTRDIHHVFFSCPDYTRQRLVLRTALEQLNIKDMGLKAMKQTSWSSSSSKALVWGQRFSINI